MTTEPALLRLLQLSSVSLPVGGYAYSQGLEYAIDSGWLKDHRQTQEWLQLQLNQSLTHLDLPLVFRLYQAFEQQDLDTITSWNQFLLACRESSELRLNDSAMGQALIRLLPQLGVALPLPKETETSFVTAFSAAAYQWQIPVRLCALGLAWSWLENQVAAATKLLPLGQTQAQHLLSELQTDINSALDSAELLNDDQLGASLPGLALASAMHESQYSRLFRS